MCIAGKINEILNQLQLLIKIYGNASLADIQKSVATIKKIK